MLLYTSSLSQDATLLHSEVADLKSIDSMSSQKVLFYVERLPSMLPKRMEEMCAEALDASEMAFVKLQAYSISEDILNQE